MGCRLKQDQLTETVALRGRLEETMGDHQAQQAGATSSEMG